MKTSATAGRERRQTTSAGERKPSSGGKAAALAPPSYGIDFVDRGLPARLRAGIESLSGIDLSDVRVHANSAKPARLGALAYAQGNDIHLAPGQERSLPHEAWHVVQQRQGRVRETLQMNGSGINDDPALEREADAMGARALQTAGNGARPGAAQRVGAANPVIQRDVGFEFETDWIVKKKIPNRGLQDLWGAWPSWTVLGYREQFYADPGGGFDAIGDDHSNIEFRTHHFPETVAGIGQLTNAMAALTALATQLDARRNSQHFEWQAPLPMPGLQKAVRVKPVPRGAHLTAAPQATIGVRMGQVHNMLREVSSHANMNTLMGTGDAQLMRTVAAKAANAGNVNGAAPSRELKGLLTLLMSYIYKGHAPYLPGVQNHLTYSKLIAPVMARTDFVEMFANMPEAVYFGPGGIGGPAAFSAYVIATINLPAVVGTDPVFRHGFGDGHGGVTMLPLTRDAWLQGIANGVDNLSSVVNPNISSSLGSKGHGLGSTDPDAGGNIGVPGMVMELRRMSNLPFAQWQPMAIRMATFVSNLNNNTVNPDNPVAY